MDKPTNHEFDFDLINEFFTELERQGPGSVEETVRALSFIDGLPGMGKIADLGCGTGFQTMVLARETKADIAALDLCAGSIAKLDAQAESLGFGARVEGIVGAMDDLPFQEGEFDLVWSEGAIGNIGFEKGLRYWRRFLKQGGYVAVTYESWFTEERPAEIEKWWVDAVPGIATIGQNVLSMQRAGYIPVAVFTLPDSCWTEHYFAPQRARREEFLREHEGDRVAEDFVAFMQREESLYARYGRFYGYAFYIGKKA